jgi:uncharacterized membrane protein
MEEEPGPARKSCQACGTEGASILRPAAMVRHALAELIQQETGYWNEDGWICLNNVQRLQQHDVEEMLKAEKGELTQLEQEVPENPQKQGMLSANADIEFDATLTRGQLLAGRIAAFGGSRIFLIVFGVVMFAWMLLSSQFLTARLFDPYPFILLSFCLSCLAAIQAQVIMMSQNRQEARDRLRAVRASQVSPRAELEIRHLHQRLDHLLSRQWERLVEIQKIQMELIDEIRRR